MSLEIGAPAPDFTLKDQFGQEVSLSGFAGETHVILVFYPFAFSGKCTGELCEIRDNLAVFQDAAVQVVGISVDPLFAQRAFAEAQGYDFPLLSDFWPHGGVAQQYGVFNETSGSAFRASFLIDKAGVLRWSIINGMGEARPLAAYQEAVAAL